MTPLVQAAIWVVMCCVCGFLGYRQGRQDEELRWRRALEKRLVDHKVKP